MSYDRIPAIHRWKLLRACLTLSIAAIGGTLLAQTVPGGGPSPSPAGSWAIHFKTSGSDYIGSGSGGQPVSWAPPPPYNNVWMQGGSYSAGRSVSGNITPTTNLSSSGQVTIRVTWTDPNNPPPAEVYLAVDSTASGTSTSGQGEASNAFSDPPTAYTEYYAGRTCTGKLSTGRRCFKLKVTNGEAIRTFGMSASTSVSGTNAAAREVCSISASVTNKFVTIQPWISPTYAVGPHDNPIPIVNEDLEDIRMNVGISQFTPTTYGVYGVLEAVLGGPWYSPTYTWSWKHSAYDPANRATLLRNFTNLEVASIAENGPVVLRNMVTATDTDGNSEESAITINMYAPEQFPTLPTVNIARDAWARVSPVVNSHPTAPFSLSNSIAYSKAITKQLSGGFDGTFKFGKDSPLTLALKLQYQYSETATVTKTNTVTYNIPANTGRKYWIEKQNFWIEKSGSYLKYGPAGYEGLMNLFYTGWVSGTKEMAEQIDHEVQLKDVPIL